MVQQTLSDMEYGNRRRKTRREEFLGIMDGIIPWDEWVEAVRPHYPQGKRGRPPVAIETILRMYLLQLWYRLSDKGAEDAIYDSYAMRRFLGINFMEEQVPDATTLLHFRHRMEQSGVGRQFSAAVRRGLRQRGLVLHAGSVTEAALAAAPRLRKRPAPPADGGRTP